MLSNVQLTLIWKQGRYFPPSFPSRRTNSACRQAGAHPECPCGSLIHCCDHAQSPPWCRALGWLCLNLGAFPICPSSLLAGAPHSGNRTVLLPGARLGLLHIPTLCCSDTGQGSPPSACDFLQTQHPPFLILREKPLSEG